MLTVYRFEQDRLGRHDMGSEAALPDNALWLDLFAPTVEEQQKVDELLGIESPTRAEMEEIEVSSRLYQEQDALYMTALILSGTDTELPQSAAITFILTGGRLVTLRHTEPRPFRVFAARAQRYRYPLGQAELVLVGLLDAIIDRAADILERIGGDIDSLSHEVFREHGDRRDFNRALRRLGQIGDLTSKVRESLVSMARLLIFFSQAISLRKGMREVRSRVKTLSRDVQSLSDHATFLSSKISFLLDATLGLINIEQNAIIKIFSVVAVIFLPPTLVASIYGMNFDFMPELHWGGGYPLALLLMVISALLPFLFFKRRGWL